MRWVTWKMGKKSSSIKEYLRLGRLFNAEILSLIFVLSYMLSSKIHDVEIDVRTLSGLFVAGILAHMWGAYNNDRMDLAIDKDVSYCSHKPLVSGSISIEAAKRIEFFVLSIFIFLILYISPKISTMVYLFCAVTLAYLYNRFNRSNMFINIVGQMYAGFAVLIGMSVVVDFDFVVFLSALVIGLNGVYLNIVEADLKDIKGDVVNVPRALGVRFRDGKAVNIRGFYILNEGIKLCMFVLILYILFLEKADGMVFVLACVFFVLNFAVRCFMFLNLSSDRERMKPYIAGQELTSILFIGTIYMVVLPFLPIVLVFFVLIWFLLWNKFLWGTCFRPQV
ncbi:MAG: hypothetical protein DRN08_04495 [Thermoplasmata archaeon]|nr:MAG: hypothetical protein DRN08_04495 [Thermoplasmata archaeon]